MVEIFKTNVIGKKAAKVLLKTLGDQFPGYYFNFDLDDCDRILRVESCTCGIPASEIIAVVTGKGVSVELFME